MKRILIVLSCISILAVQPAFSAVVPSVREALELFRKYPGGETGDLEDFEWVDIVGCECDERKGVCTDSSDELCNVQCCINKYGKKNAFEVKGVCCRREDDDCICRANGCRTGEHATPLDSYCCAKEKGII